MFLPIPDSTVRLANLRSGQLDFIERLAASDVPQVKSDARFRMTKITEIGYQGITINVGKSDLAQKNPLGRDPRVREAFELALDRDGIVQVAMDGEADRRQPVGRADQHLLREERADARSATSRGPRRCCRKRACTNPAFTLMTPTTADAQRIAQVVQAMASEAGFDVKIQSTEFATSLDLADKGAVRGVRARVERPRRSRRQHLQLRRVQAAAQLRRLLQAGSRRPAQPRRARRATSPSGSKLFEQLAAIVLKDRPIVYLYHRHWLWALREQARRDCARFPTASCGCRRALQDFASRRSLRRGGRASP